MKHYQFGVDYYPEHWPKERWAADAHMMHEMGIQIVRLGEFSWSKFEPSEGDFHFEDLDDAIRLLAAQGIDVVLGTPTAAPPAWIIQQAPDIQPMDAQGLRKFFGGRHHACPSNPAYRRHIGRYVTALAAHFANNPAVVGWQVDNELGNSHIGLCYCPNCEASFRQWLRKKHGSIEALNQAWGTCFWSQEYPDFAAVHAPKATPCNGWNPSHQQDWQRFTSDLVCEFHHFQADILRSAAPDKFITHNLMGLYPKPNYYELGKQLDFASHDQYPAGHFHPRHAGYRADFHAAELDFIRAVKQKPFWIMEQQSGIAGWEVLGRAPKPGQLGLWAMQSIAHGADTIIFFRWRSCPVGTEQYWHGILPHNGIPGRYYHELHAFMHKYTPLLAALHGSLPHAETAILRSYDQEYAISTQPHHPDHRYATHLLAYYNALHRMNVPVDFVGEHHDFTPYKLLIAPLQFLMSPALAEKFRAYVAQGGRLLLTWRSGVRTPNNTSYTEGNIPCLVDDLCGLAVTEYDCLRDAENFIRWDGVDYPCQHWCDVIHPTTAAPLAAYTQDFYAGTPAVTRNAYGKGAAYYIGTTPDESLAAKLTAVLCGDAGVTSLLDTPHGIEAVHRVTADGLTFLFLLNHNEEACQVVIPDDWTPWDEQPWTGEISGMDTRVFVKKT